MEKYRFNTNVCAKHVDFVVDEHCFSKVLIVFKIDVRGFPKQILPRFPSDVSINTFLSRECVFLNLPSNAADE